jgi:hypothetical protein
LEERRQQRRNGIERQRTEKGLSNTIFIPEKSVSKVVLVDMKPFEVRHLTDPSIESAAQHVLANVEKAQRGGVGTIKRFGYVSSQQIMFHETQGSTKVPHARIYRWNGARKLIVGERNLLEERKGRKFRGQSACQLLAD